MSLEEGTPVGATLPVGGFEDIADCSVRDVKAHISQRPLDAVVAPGWVFLSEAKSQVNDFLPNAWSAEGLSLVRMIPLPGDEFSMPSQERVRCDDRGQLVEGFAAERLALESQASALVIVQEDSALTELFPQYLIFSQQILEGVLLVSVDPTGQDEKQKLPGL